MTASEVVTQNAIPPPLPRQFSLLRANTSRDTTKCPASSRGASGGSAEVRHQPQDQQAVFAFGHWLVLSPFQGEDTWHPCWTDPQRLGGPRIPVSESNLVHGSKASFNSPSSPLLPASRFSRPAYPNGANEAEVPLPAKSGPSSPLPQNTIWPTEFRSMRDRDVWLPPSSPAFWTTDIVAGIPAVLPTCEDTPHQGMVKQKVRDNESLCNLWNPKPIQKSLPTNFFYRMKK
ncbi:uncharacterized protein LOC114009754 [Tupaia chinensis]|uniref:uncharacterized protein LOC114009754 n=1 Tax=Tupaia chinensis TaxID=246437 RepID=UPI000FFC5EEA|nr:uncharacterized protein LOC114009754 [Tupaia chinensis]